MSHGRKPRLTPIGIDNVRASKAGHAYHEAWAARTALEMLPPDTDLVAITLEGLASVDEDGLDAAAVEVADLVRYHGGPGVARAKRAVVVQFKYSIARATTPLRAADLAPTLAKFASTDASLEAKHGAAHVEAVVAYEFVTNRPIHPGLSAAMAATLDGRPASGDVARQAGQLAAALAGADARGASLLRRLDILGGQGALPEAERNVARTLASWSAPSDPDAEKRLLKLRNLIRIKAGAGSEDDKSVNRVAVLAELDVWDEETLYPTPDAFPEVGTVVERAALEEVTSRARGGGGPLLIHAAGGMGKTVLMQGLARRLAADGPVLVFDGFGAGRWRDPSDSRHLPERTLVHLANLLAGRGLSDILLPVADTPSLLKAFRRRLEQAVRSAREQTAGAHLSLVLDAIDHAGISAEETGTRSFAHLLLRSVIAAPIDGVRIVASCRTERIALATGGAVCQHLAIPSFTPDEARALVAARQPDATAAETAALLARSGRNPRCLDGLIAAGRPFDPVALPDDRDADGDLLDELLGRRLSEARATALARGATEADIDLLLAGIALLAPPVPVNELAAAHGLAAEQVESFAADLAPLLERTPHGLMFRDEPTETLIRQTYGADEAQRARVVAALQARQDASSYAARALPALLTSMRDADPLIALAYDRRVPAGASQVSARDIRLARLTAAIALTADLGRRDDLLQLLMEASVVAAGHERSDRFLYEFPDLTGLVGDAETLRRLAATSVGWPGGKHAALAITASVAGDTDEARRHARRSIDWHNWAAQSDDDRRVRGPAASNRWDETGFAYVEALAGNADRVAEFFARRPAGTAFDRFGDLFDLLERHRRSAHAPADRIPAALARCRLSSRPLLTAALRFTDGRGADARRLLAALADVPAAEGGHERLATACVQAAIRAAEMGMAGEATRILDRAGVTRQSVHSYSSPYPLERTLEATVMSAGVRAALRRRAPSLMDIVPRELFELVPPSVRTRGPAAFAKHLHARLAPPGPGATGGPRKRRRAPAEDRSDLARSLAQRVQPLLAYAQDVADLISSPRGNARTAVLAKAFDRLRGDVARASDYPYRDGKGYVARIGFLTLFGAADALGSIGPKTASRMAEWLGGPTGLFTQELTAVAERMSRRSSCHDAALALAGHVDRTIRADTDVGSRVTSYGRLARAMWRVDADEAGGYFRRALDLAEAIGSDDFERTNHLLELTSHYTGPELDPETTHTLARILELNQGDDDRFPWIEFAQTMVPLAGRRALATLARLDDRGVTRLRLSLGPMLTTLVRQSKIPAETAIALSGLAPPAETWTWHLSDLAAAAAETLPPGRIEWLLATMLVEIDRDDQLSPARATIEGLHRLAVERLPAQSPTRRRIEALHRRRGSPDAGPVHAAPAEAPETMERYPTDLRDADDVDRLILAEEMDASGRRWPVKTLRDLAARPKTPAQRLRFVRAVVDAGSASLADKLHALDDRLADWSGSSVALGDALPALGLRLAERHAAELADSGHEAWGGWRGLVRDFRADTAELVEKVVASLRGTAAELSGDGWLSLAAKLAAVASDGAIATGLERLLATVGGKLPAEVGDGPWSEGFRVPDDEAAAVAGLLWARLGHPDAAARWRAAHAVRRFAAVGRRNVVDELVGRFDADGGLPFSDARLPFYPMHARLWLLIALARIALDDPVGSVRHRPLLERVALSTAFPHVLMRSFALDALRAISGTAGGPAGSEIAAIEAVNASLFPAAPRDDHREFRWMKRPDARPRPEDAFHLDYDFGKYQVERLCGVFGRPGWEVEDRIGSWVRRWDPAARSMYDCPRGGGEDDAWSSGYPPAHDRHGSYLGWHALMLAAGEMLATLPVVGRDWSGDAWKAFLDDYRLSSSDGLWLADLTDPFPLDLATPEQIRMPEVERDGSASEDASILAPMLGIAGGRVVERWLPVAGRWSIDRNTTVGLASVLANPADARSAAMTLLSDAPFFRFLPDDEEEIRRNFGEEGHSVEEWVDERRNTERRLDRHDPYAASTALNRPFPNKETRRRMAVSADDVATRRWSSAVDPVFRAEAWGAKGGRGEHAWEEEGSRLRVDVEALLPMLRASRRRLVLLLKVRKYHRAGRGRRAPSGGGFSHRSIVAIVDGAGGVWIARRLSAAAARAVAALGRDRDFHPRFRAIAGLPDEHLARRLSMADDLPRIEIVFAELDGQGNGD